MRIARVERVSGAPMVVAYDCDDDDDDARHCPETACICAPGMTYDEDLFARCSDSWTRRRKAGDGKLRCRSGDDAATLVIYREGGAISFSGLGGAGVAQVKKK